MAKGGHTGATEWQEIKTPRVLLESHSKCKAEHVMGFSLPITGSPQTEPEAPAPPPGARGFFYAA